MGRVMNYLVGIVLVSVSAGAVADDIIDLDRRQALGLIDTVMLEVVDSVTGGCWTNANKLKQEVRLKLEQSGIAVEEDIKPWYANTAVVQLNATGGRAGEMCFGSYSFTVSRFAPTFENNVRTAAYVEHFEDAAVSVRASLNTDLARLADGAVTKFAADVLKYRRDAKVIEALEQLKGYRQ